MPKGKGKAGQMTMNGTGHGKTGAGQTMNGGTGQGGGPGMGTWWATTVKVRESGGERGGWAMVFLHFRLRHGYLFSGDQL